MPSLSVEFIGLITKDVSFLNSFGWHHQQFHSIPNLSAVAVLRGSIQPCHATLRASSSTLKLQWLLQLLQVFPSHFPPFAKVKGREKRIDMWVVMNIGILWGPKREQPHCFSPEAIVVETTVLFWNVSLTMLLYWQVYRVTPRSSAALTAPGLRWRGVMGIKWYKYRSYSMYSTVIIPI